MVKKYFLSSIISFFLILSTIQAESDNTTSTLPTQEETLDTISEIGDLSALESLDGIENISIEEFEKNEKEHPFDANMDLKTKIKLVWLRTRAELECYFENNPKKVVFAGVVLSCATIAAIIYLIKKYTKSNP